jgi:hypothetical protein
MPRLSDIAWVELLVVFHGDPAIDFNTDFLAQWKNTSNYALFSRLTSDALLSRLSDIAWVELLVVFHGR